ncbi:Fork-head transcriptional regulator [Lachnellula occidentalis]|uniref:Fork-head transcriptional regulator n=1 Tax=Lachnellula occidentalis TaxID=215460 RepID=A0A8H8RGY1_9HELO|nr:Fork-head transcriptional regulator [Lachnellula occidentalis]
MNSEHYRRRHQINSLPLNFQYAESSGTPMQSTHQMLSFDGLPRAQNDQQFMITPSTVPSISSNYSLTTPMAMPQASTVWSDPSHTSMDFDSQNTNDYYDYSPSITGNEQDSPFLRGMSYSEVPRTCFPCDPRMLNDGGNMALDSFDASAYMMDPNKNDMQTSTEPTSTSLGFDALENSHNFSRLSISHSPKLEDEPPSSDHFSFNKPTPFPLPSSEPSENGGTSSREMTAVDGDDPSADEPYAKLIHRALMSAPDHSMVLQEIYEWFRKHTAKGASDTKGWMNSIRHNLSMNAAFKKTERKTPGDETKKSTEWVLEEFAIKDGVQSTTRYRKGTGAKKFMKTENPAPSRQSSGRKGGISASKTKLQRQQARSICLSGTHRSRHGHGHEFLRSPHFPAPRHSSPLTPPTHENIPGVGCNPYFFPKQQQMEMPYEDMCGLQDVQGVYIDDNGPLFANSQDYASSVDGLSRY